MQITAMTNAFSTKDGKESQNLEDQKTNFEQLLLRFAPAIETVITLVFSSGILSPAASTVLGFTSIAKVSFINLRVATKNVGKMGKLSLTQILLSTISGYVIGHGERSLFEKNLFIIWKLFVSLRREEGVPDQRLRPDCHHREELENL